jgi:hypothetical protein
MSRHWVTYVVVPAWSDQAGQCRIVARVHDQGEAAVRPGLQDYRRNPNKWWDVGLMGSDGTIRCLQARPNERAIINEAVPIMAGTAFHFEREA